MTDDEILAEFRAAEALLQGHFLLSSGRHSEYYLQCARVLMDTERAGRLAIALAAKLPRDLRAAIDMVVSPAMGGVIIGHEMGRALGKPAIFVERPTGTFELRRGFAIPAGAKILMVEDVVTTGLSSREAMEAGYLKLHARGKMVDKQSGAATALTSTYHFPKDTGYLMTAQVRPEPPLAPQDRRGLTRPARLALASATTHTSRRARGTDARRDGHAAAPEAGAGRRADARRRAGQRHRRAARQGAGCQVRAPVELMMARDRD